MNASLSPSRSDDGGLDAVLAVVLTYRRPRLATSVVRGLLEVEGFSPANILLVINGEGGLEDVDLQEQLAVLHLPENVGPAGGFRAALEAARSRPDCEWIYLCEDDVGLFDLPAPRVARLVADGRLMQLLHPTNPVGAIVAYGRDLHPLTGSTSPHGVSGKASGYEEVDAAAWGASLVSRQVVDAGIFPDSKYFIDFEDFDFLYRVRKAGFRILVDRAAALAAAKFTLTSAGRDAGIQDQRPLDHQEPWRAYYVARNFFFLARTHGRPLWFANHLLYTARRLQRASSRAERIATLRGVRDGIRGRGGKNSYFERSVGEYS